MNIEQVRECFLKLPYVTEDMPFGDDYVVFRLGGKIFGGLPLTKPNLVVLKCDAARAEELRAEYGVIEPAWHWNKKYWNQIDFAAGVLDRQEIEELIEHAYNEVEKKLPKKIREQLGR